MGLLFKKCLVRLLELQVGEIVAMIQGDDPVTLFRIAKLRSVGFEALVLLSCFLRQQAIAWS